jgi:type III pantothenate kinase
VILEMDFGNSRIKWRLRSGIEILLRGVIDREKGLVDLVPAIQVYVRQLKAISVVSVLDESAKVWINFWAKKNLNIVPRYAVSQMESAGVINGYDDPTKLGVDRWLAVVAAYNLCKSSCVVISCGTALTVDLVNQQGRHLGGYIVPGWNTAMYALNANTQLINLNEIKSSKLVPGTSTQAAVGHGLAACYIGLIQNAITQLGTRTNSGLLTILATGGDAKRLQELFPEIRLCEELILDGLAYCLV